jgi:hypothetical protein
VAKYKPYNPNYKSSKPDGEGRQAIGQLLTVFGGITTLLSSFAIITNEIEYAKLKKNKNITYTLNNTIINGKAYHTICFNYKF